MSRLRTLTAALHPRHYLVLGVFCAVVIPAGILYQNFTGIWQFFTISGSFSATGTFIIALLLGATKSMSLLSLIGLVLFAIFFGLNVILLVQYISQKRAERLCEPSGSSVAATIGGGVASIFGIGCAACGTAIFFSLLNLFGAGGLLLLLPLHGEEFVVIGILLLTYTTWYLLGKL